jgi:hypothetical protein
MTDSEAERAALAPTKAATRLSDQTEPVPDAIFDEAAKHYNPSTVACTRT